MIDIENYYAKLGLEYDPFLKNSKDVFVDTPESREVMSRLEYLQKIKGFGLLTGEPGVGKTTCIRNWCKGLSPALYKVIYSSLSTVTVQEFYRHLAMGLGASPAYHKVENFHRIQDEITRYTLEKRITPVIIIDEADHMSGKILSDLKILFNFEMDSKDRAIVLLTGLPLLNNTLRLSAHEAVRQRIIMNYNMQSLDKIHGKEYIQKKLSAAGGVQDLFDDASVEAILNASSGRPRMINRICSQCLLIAGSSDDREISPNTVMKAVNDMELG